MFEWLADSTNWKLYSASASVIGGYAAGLGILIGGVSLLMILLQTRSNSKVSRQIASIQSRKDYIKICLEYPELSSSDMVRKILNISTFKGFLGIENSQSEQALWFLSYVLFAMEQEIITYSRWGGNSSVMEKNVEEQLGYHAALLEEVWPAWKKQYSQEMNEVVTSVLQRQFIGPEIDIGHQQAIPSETEGKSTG